MKKRNLNNVMLAIVLVAIGVLLLLVNIGVISLEIKELFVDFYPILFIISGLKWLIESIIRYKSRWFLSIFFILFGILLCLDRLGFVTFHFSMFWKLWPIVFILIGVKILFRRKRVIISKTHDRLVKTEIEKKINSIVGDLEFDQSNWSVEPMDLNTVIGDLHLDFSKAYIPDENTVIQISSIIGDVKMLVPEDVPIKVEANVRLGEIFAFGNIMDGFNRVFTYTSDNYEKSTRKLTFFIELKIGSLRIDNV